jgi:hypothetical protein
VLSHFETFYAASGHVRGKQRLFADRRQAFQEVGVHATSLKVRIGENTLVQRERRLDAFHYEHIQRPAHAGNGLGAISAMNDQFGYQ